MGKSKSSLILVASLCLTVLTAPSAPAAEKKAVLDEIVVTDSRIKEEKRAVTTNITIITREDLEQSPARNLGELLAEKGIGYIQRYPGASTSIGARPGFDQRPAGRYGQCGQVVNGKR